jgi:hypothetical protein
MSNIELGLIYWGLCQTLRGSAILIIIGGCFYNLAFRKKIKIRFYLSLMLKLAYSPRIARGTFIYY